MASEQLYELVVIFDGKGEESEIMREFDIVQSLVERKSVELLGRVDWGLRNFMFPIKKKTSGYYVYYLFKGLGDSTGQISNALKMDEKILRHMIVRCNANACDQMEVMKRKMEQGHSPSNAFNSQLPEMLSDDGDMDGMGDSDYGSNN
jgi:small subunit ribosomal protein S6